MNIDDLKSRRTFLKEAGTCAAATMASSGLFPATAAESTTMTGDPLFFIRDSDRPEAKLLYKPTGKVALSSADGSAVYEEGKDFSVDPETRMVTLIEGSRVPFTEREGLYPAANAPHSIPGKKDSDRHLLWSEGHFFHDLQASATYKHSGAEWSAISGTSKSGALPKTRDLLKKGKPLKLVLLGDSISEGYNASGFVGAKPGQPAYGDLVARGLSTRFGTNVDFKNLALAGMDTNWGIAQIPAAVAERPDLFVLAFGMNDVGGKTPEEYATKTETILRGVKEKVPDCETILVSTMIGNLEWNVLPSKEKFIAYRDALVGLTSQAVALADVTSTWEKLLERKTFHDLTGNGVNHPNDFGHRMYAETILALFED